MTNAIAMDQGRHGTRARVFDAYGTLFDFASAAQRCSEALGEVTPRLAALWRDKQLQYSWLRTVQGHHADFWQVTGDALDFALDALGITDPGLRERLMLLYLTLDAYPEVPAVLRQLRDVGFATAILSNGSPTMLTAAVDHSGLGAMFDHVLSIEDVGVYKPHPSVYRLACNHLGLTPAPSLSCRRNLGTHGPPRLMACAFSGATASVRSASGWPAAPIARSAR
jgi:2-haloacid dehalogenase